MTERDWLVKRLRGVRDAMPPADDLSPAAEIFRAGLEGREEEIVEAVQKMDRREIDVVLRGTPVLAHSVRVDFLSRVLNEMQESVSSIGQTLLREPTNRSSIDGTTRAATALRMTGTFDGSFGLRLEGPEHPGIQSTMFDEEEADTEADGDVFDASVGALLEVLEASGDDNYRGRILESVAGLGPRAVSHLEGLSKVLATAGGSTDFIWHSPHEQRQIRVDVPRAERLVEILSKTELTESEVVVEGRLGGASDIRGRFELEMDDGSVWQGRVAPEIVDDLANFFGQQCEARIKITVVRHGSEGTESMSYTLMELS